MSASSGVSWRTVIIAAIATGISVAIAYAVWTEANALARMFARGTVLTDLRFFVGLIAVFAALSVLHFGVARVGARLKARGKLK